MNTFFKILSVLIAASIPVVAFAEITGLANHVAVQADVLTGIFAAVATVAFVINDYSRTSRSLVPVARVYRLGTEECAGAKPAVARAA